MDVPLYRRKADDQPILAGPTNVGMKLIQDTMVSSIPKAGFGCISLTNSLPTFKMHSN